MSERDTFDHGFGASVTSGISDTIVTPTNVSRDLGRDSSPTTLPLADGSRARVRRDDAKAVD